MAYDVGWSDDLSVEALAGVLDAVYLFAPNEKEALKLTGEDRPEAALLRLRDYVEQPIVKLGKDGAIFLRDGKIAHCPAFPFRAVDTTGAGDSFCAGFCYGLAKEWDLLRSVIFGNAVGAFCVSQMGASAGIPPEGQVLRFIREKNGTF